MNDPVLLPPPGTAAEFAVVGIGASAGGLAALQAFFERLPEVTRMAYVVVVHLSPDHESHIGDLLQKATKMPVTAVTKTVSIHANRVYVISPKSQLRMYDGKLEPVARGQPGRSMTIDVFFETLADAHQQRAFAIVLSGSGTDGTLGVRAVRAQGGVTFAQDPDEAEYDSMPRSAIASGVIDFVLPVAAMPAKLVSTWNNARAITLPQLPERITIEDATAQAEQAVREILATVRARTGHDFTHYKRATLLRRIERRLQVNQLRDLPTYAGLVAGSATETQALLSDLLISVTSFFRDPAVFEQIEKTIVPALFAGREPGARIRIWVPGCATGEEAYSIAMLFAEHAQSLSSPPPISIFATDIDEEALATARAGLYPESIADQLTPQRLRRWFVREQVGYRVQKQLRELVMFAEHNVIQDPPFSQVDLVSCRNLLIYLNRTIHAKVLDLLHFALRPDGYLVLGMAETMDDLQDGFSAVDKKLRIFSQQPRARAALALAHAPTVPRPPRTGDTVSASGRRLVSHGELHQRLLEHYAAPSVVVDERYEIVHLSDSAGRYLQLGPGEPSLGILKAVPDEIRYELKSALDEAMESMRTIARSGLALRQGVETRRLTLTVHPVRDRAASRRFALVLFDERDDTRAAASDTSAPPDLSMRKALEEQLDDMQAQLRSSVEQHDVQNEELKASNEELQATNEELRATTEELETGKEELQSINEELITVNHELKNKVDETTRITDDLQNFITATGIAVLFVDRDMRLLRYTPFARDIFNLIQTDIGRPLMDITHRLADVDFQALIESTLATLQVSEYEAHGTNGRSYIVRVLPYRTTDNRIGGAVLTFIDITHRKNSEAQRHRSEAWSRVLVDSLQDYAIMTLDADGIIETWSAGARTIFGYTKEEIAGQPFDMLFVPEDRAEGVPASELEAARAAGRAEDERWQLRKSGERFFASGICAPLVTSEGGGYVKICRDLTQHKIATQRREEQLVAERVNRAAAEETNRLKDEFLATLSHELRNPLALIQMQAELLLRSKETQNLPRLASAAEIIHQTVRAQAQFVEDMLDVSRVRTGKLALDRHMVPLALVIADSIGALRDQAAKGQLTLSVEFDPEPMIVEADPVRIKQIAWNLVSNAIKFTPAGGTVTVRLRRDGNEARLDVEDTGTGIDPALLPHIFDWFRQAESGAARRKGGMGIGLALVKQLVELHGGRLRGVSGGPGKGACFSVWLPLQLVELRIVGSAQASDVPAIPEVSGRLAGKRVLIVDDLADNAEAMGELLRYEGADVGVETSAHRAITRTVGQAFDVIISDLAMPKMDGYTMLAEIRKSPLNAKTAAIAYSGFGGAEEIARSKTAGFAMHLVKPVQLEHLIEAIETVTSAVPPDVQSPSRRSAD